MMKAKIFLIVLIVFSLYNCEKKEIPTISTLPISDSTITSITTGGKISSDGGSKIISKGICYGTTTDITINNSKTIDGDGKDDFTSKIEGLYPGVKYYFRAYAINSEGVGYGNISSFEAKTTVTDIDGNIYHVVKIGTQIWLSENLKVSKLNDGTIISNISDSYNWISFTKPSYCWVQNNIDYKHIYGGLYNWYAVSSGKLAPKGWHVATQDDWLLLQEYLGGFTVAGGKLKEKGSIRWYYPNTGATNEVYFTALPAGYRSKATGNFNRFGQSALFWSSTGTVDNFGRFAINYDDASSNYANDNGNYGFSVRCVLN